MIQNIVVHAEGLGQIGATGFFDPSNPGTMLGNIVSGAFAVVLVVGGLYSFVMFIMGAFSIIGSGGDQQKLQEGRSRIIWALVGILVLAASWGLIVLIEQMTDMCFGFSQECAVNLDELAPGL